MTAKEGKKKKKDTQNKPQVPLVVMLKIKESYYIKRGENDLTGAYFRNPHKGVQMALNKMSEAANEDEDARRWNGDEDQ